MLKGISELISPELLKVLAEMGHTEEIVIADANFPAHAYGKKVIRADGLAIPALLEAILKLFPLDTYADKNVVLMSVVKGDNYVPVIWSDYERILKSAEGENVKITEIDKWEFYDRTKNATAVLITGEKSLYANILLKKGVI